MANFNKYGQKYWGAALLQVGVLLLLFSAYNNRTIALKYIAYGISIIALLLLAWQDSSQIKNKLRQPLFIWLIVFLGINAIAFLQVESALLTTCAEEYRKGLFQAGLFAAIIAIAISDLKKLGHAILALGLASLWITVSYLWEIRSSTFETILVNAVPTFRDFSVRFVFFLPFLVYLFSRPSSPLKWLWASLIFIQLVSITFSGFRGGWLGLIVMIAIWVYYSQNNRKLIGLTSICVLGVILGWGASSSEYVARKLQQTDTALRWDGTWRPSIDMVKDKPLLGHGFCDVAFRAENARLVDQHPEWALGRALMDPHSVYLESAFASGIPGLLVLLCLFWSIFRGVTRIISQTSNSPLRGYSVAVLCMFMSYFVVLGIFEPLQWEQLGLAVGLSMSLTNISRNRAWVPDPGKTED